MKKIVKQSVKVSHKTLKTIVYYCFDKLIPVILGAFIFAGVLGSYDHHAQNLDLMANGFYPKISQDLNTCENLVNQKYIAGVNIFQDRSKSEGRQKPDSLIDQYLNVAANSGYGVGVDFRPGVKIVDQNNLRPIYKRLYGSINKQTHVYVKAKACYLNIFRKLYDSALLMGRAPAEHVLHQLSEVDVKREKIEKELDLSSLTKNSLPLPTLSKGVSTVDGMLVLRRLQEKYVALSVYLATIKRINRIAASDIYSYLQFYLSNRINQSFFAYTWTELKEMF